MPLDGASGGAGVGVCTAPRIDLIDSAGVDTAATQARALVLEVVLAWCWMRCLSRHPIRRKARVVSEADEAAPSGKVAAWVGISE